MSHQSHGRHKRRGATSVELAIVAIPLFLFVFTSIEFGRGMLLRHSMEESARCGCRVAILKNATTADVAAEVDTVLAGVGVDTYTVTTEPNDLAATNRWTPIKVTVTADYSDMSWLPIPKFLGGLTFASSCTLPKEAGT